MHRFDSEQLTLRESRQVLIETVEAQEVEIQRLKQELHILRDEAWQTDACGDDMWDLD